MEIIKEIYRLPNFLYAIDSYPFWVILGKDDCQRVESFDEIEIQMLIKKLDDYCKLYSKENLSDNDKKVLGNMASIIHQRCDMRLRKYYSKDQQDTLIQNLPQSDKDKIKKQITMYKQAREYYRDFV